MDQLHAMRVFARVVETGSFTQSAEQLNLPRASVTNAVQQLERHLGVRLLHRTTRKVTLSSDGTLYYQHCQRVLAALDESDALFSGALAAPHGTVRVDLPERLARLVVIPALPDFCSRYPGIQLRLSATDRLVDLVEEGIDCVVRVGALADSSLIARRVGEMRQINCGAPDYLDRHGRPQTLAELAGHLEVKFFSNRTGRDLDWEYVQDGERKTIKLQSAVAVSSAEAYQACCLAGLGLIQAPLHGLRDDIAAGRLEAILPDYPPPPLPVSIVYSSQRLLAPRLRVFIDWLAELLAGQDWG
ncbi:DNA-binding transcriptional regulator, LysR family [Andreprevotia lacus DSM 23236]|jgi:DNA-binding transcriptional LysR family regulator|uniref:DNA-binding transcriptional regulator, LysR family n=1 Tax=Andreprevotia lacus DSM 23236 TaxID=1121001 RepID=A0A1W1XRS8_9NEIS|nr:LysR family transcriptional regulator [Andreprevotia lacus]SMC26597.1 DNA-binding transcriptional regulator, LysR family [Andreprevotia lacus DSM 23236]